MLLLVHGYPYSHHTWLPLIERLSPHYQVVAYDVRGSGQSSHPGAVSDYRLTHLANDLRAVARAVGQGQLDLATTGAAVVPLRGQWTLHAGRGDLQHIRLGFRGHLVQQFGCDAREIGDRIEVQTRVTVGHHDDARRPCGSVHPHIFDVVSGVRKSTAEQLKHLACGR